MAYQYSLGQYERTTHDGCPPSGQPSRCPPYQEPWFYSIVPRHSDVNPTRIPLLSLTLNPCWTPFLPPHSPTHDTCNVAFYVCTSLLLDPDIFAVLPRPSHPWTLLSCMVVNLSVHGKTIRLVNMYHQVADSHLSNDFRTILPHHSHNPTYRTSSLGTSVPTPAHGPSPLPPSLLECNP